MSSKDNTGDKLVASVRKSKTGTVARKTSKRSAKRESAAKSIASTTKSESTKATHLNGKDGFSLGRRVWPD